MRRLTRREIPVREAPWIDGAGTLAAAGTYGGEMYRDFFSAYKSELRREFSGSQAKQQVYGQARVWHISEYTKQQVLC